MKKMLQFVGWWRIALFLVVTFTTSVIGFLFPYPNFEYLIQQGSFLPPVWTWGGFDGVHYMTIAEGGYIADNTQAFFPIYPLFMRLVYLNLKVNSLFSGLIVSNVSLFIALALFWKLLRTDFAESKAFSVIILFLLFPNSFYLGAVYSESTFLVFLFGSFLAARKRQWFIAGVLGAVASATRFVGIFIFPALLVELWSQFREKKSTKQSKKNLIMQVLSICLVPLGLFFYMNYLQVHFNDPLKFLHSQHAFGGDRSEQIILLYQVFWRYAKMMVTVSPLSILYFRVLNELFWSTLFLVLGIASFKKARLSYAIFSAFAYLAPTLTGTFSSMGRYVLVMFPAFIVFSNWLEHHATVKKGWYIFSGILLIVDLSLFVTGRWVA